MQFKTLKEIYDHSVEAFADRKAFSMIRHESLTYREFGERVERTRELLLNSGIGHGDKVALFSRSTTNWPIAYFSCVTAGITIVPILPDFSHDEVENLLEHSGVKGLFVSGKLASLISEETYSRMNIAVSTDDMSIMHRSSEELAEAAVPQPEDLAAIIYTSGTTSSPKGVMLTQFALANQINLYPTFFPIVKEDSFLSFLPLSHVYECSVGMLYPFAFGCSVTYLDRLPAASVLLPAFKTVRPSVFLTVPLILDKIYRSQVRSRMTKNGFLNFLYKLAPVRKVYHRIAGKAVLQALGGNIRFIGIGGSKVNEDTERFLLEGGIPYAIGYGLTETAPLLFAIAPGDNRIGSTGKVITTIEYRLDDMDPKTGEGELVVKTPCIMQGYYKNPEKTAEAFTADGWFKTNDICTVSKDGYLSIKGRANNMIVGASGENIYPEEIEDVINSHSLVEESLVIEDNGELIALVSFNKEQVEAAIARMGEEMNEGMEKIKKELTEFVNTHVNRFSRIKAVEEQKEPFIKTPSQKIKRFLYKRDTNKKK